MPEFRKWTLAKHPVGVPERDCFALEPCAQGDIQDGEVLIKVDYFSLDPGMRGRLSGDSYAAGLKIGDTIESAGVGTILESKSDKFAPGDVVSGALGWSEATVHRDRGLKIIEPSLLSEHVSATAFIGVLGVPGLTAWFGLNDLGGPSGGRHFINFIGRRASWGHMRSAWQAFGIEGCRYCRWPRKMRLSAYVGF